MFPSHSSFSLFLPLALKISKDVLFKKARPHSPGAPAGLAACDLRGPVPVLLSPPSSRSFQRMLLRAPRKSLCLKSASRCHHLCPHRDLLAGELCPSPSLVRPLQDGLLPPSQRWLWPRKDGALSHLPGSQHTLHFQGKALPLETGFFPPQVGDEEQGFLMLNALQEEAPL